jgi:hypothetical protein
MLTAIQRQFAVAEVGLVWGADDHKVDLGIGDRFFQRSDNIDGVPNDGAASLLTGPLHNRVQRVELG